MIDFNQYLRNIYGVKNGTTNSYMKAIEILDNILKEIDIRYSSGKSIVSITDPGEIYSLYEYVKSEEKKMKKGEDSIFIHGLSNQKSYPGKGFCSAAVKSLFNYRESLIQQEALDCLRTTKNNNQLMNNLKKITSISETEVNAEIHQRIGQNVFREVLLEIYKCKCCVSGLNIKELLRASHILPWAENTANRLNPENGLCLSVLYDAAFDKYLISFDEDYKMVVSPYIRDYYTNATVKSYFSKYEGKKLTLPEKFIPNTKFLEKHREKLIGG